MGMGRVARGHQQGRGRDALHDRGHQAMERLDGDGDPGPIGAGGRGKRQGGGETRREEDGCPFFRHDYVQTVWPNRPNLIYYNIT